MRKVRYRFLERAELKEFKGEAVKTVRIMEGENGEIMSDWFESLYDNDEPEKKESNTTDSETDENELFSDNIYGDGKHEVYRTGEEEFDSYTADEKFICSKKEALTSIESRTPFLVGKTENTKAQIDENDFILRTVPKIGFKERKRVKRTGFIRTYDKPVFRNFNISKFSERKKNKILGILNSSYFIHKKRGFNQKKIGYIKVRLDTAGNFDNGTEYYVEVTKSKGLQDVLIILLICLLVSGIIHFKPDNWSMDNFNIYRTEESISYEEFYADVTHKAETVLKNGEVDISLDLSRIETENPVTVRVLDESGEVVYEEPAEGNFIKKIFIDKEYEAGTYEMQLEVEIEDTGILKSTFEMITE